MSPHLLVSISLCLMGRRTLITRQQVAVPALFAVAVYSIYFFVVRPIIARYRDLPNQELPSHSFTDSAISKTVSLGHRISNRLAAIGLPWNRRSDGEAATEGSHRRGSTASDSFLDEDADNMAGFDVRDVHRRREELHRQVLGMEGASRYAQTRSWNT